MPAKFVVLNWFRQHKWAVYALIFAVLLIIHTLIFREALGAIPDIMRGDAVIVRDELVPFFDFNTQFWPESTAGLTSSEEVRVIYSFWTSWVRYYWVLPFALVLLNAISAFVLFYAFYRIGRYFALQRPLAVMFMAALSSFLIHFILLYAKITHFYTLIFGFALFALAMSLMLEQLFFKRDISWRNVVQVTLLVLLNPAIHYHVIFYFIFAFFVLLHCVVNVILNRKYAGFYFKRNFIYTAIVTGGSLIPYGAFIYITSGGASDVSTNIPSNFWMIYYSSVPLTSLFALDTAAPIDMFRYGSYFVPSPRVATMLVISLIVSLFVAKQWRVLHIGKRIFLLILMTALLLSTWMAMGYTTGFSFHAVVGWMALSLIGQANIVAHMIGQGMLTFVNILRYPHRFQFIFYYLAGVMLVVALLWLFDKIHHKRQLPIAACVVVLVAMSPILLAKDYLSVLVSGNFAAFLHPYPISPDLKQIRSQLAQTKDPLVFILPSLESGRDINVGDQKFNFIDKFMIYYLNSPTLYYGTGGKPDHKAISYAVYRSIEDAQPWWDDILVNSLGITHLLVPTQTSARDVGLSYMPNIDLAIAERLSDSPLFQKTHDGADYALYEATQRSTTQHTLLDMQWHQLSEQLASTPAEGRLYFPMQLRALTREHQETNLLTTSPERSFYNLYATRNPAATFYPSSAQLAFSEELIASSNFTVSALSMSKLNNKYDDYNYIGERMPSLLNTLTAQFVGVPAGNAGITVSAEAPQDGTYRLLLHAASQAQTIIGAVDNRGVVFEKLADDSQQQDYIDMSYYYTDIELPQGASNITLHNPGNHALVAESLTLLPMADLPRDFTQNINKAGIRLEQSDQAHIYKVKMEAS